MVFLNLIIFSTALLVCGKIYNLISEQYIKKIKFYQYVLGFVTICFGSNILFLLRGFKYDIPISCGILFINLTIYLLLLLQNQKHIKLKLFLAGITIAFIVCSKPTFIAHYIWIAYILFIIQKKYIKNKLNLLYLIFPLTTIAILQMIYNYLRYDSIFEFGAKYQLTSFNLLDYIGFSWNKFLRSIKLYLFTLPKFDFSKFPYIFMRYNTDNSYYNEFLYEGCYIGLFAFPVILQSLPFLFKTKNIDISFNILKNCLRISYITLFIIILVNSIVAGVAENYFLEIKFVLIVLSILCFLKYISLIPTNSILNTIFLFCCIINIVIIIPISYSGDSLILLNL